MKLLCQLTLCLLISTQAPADYFPLQVGNTWSYVYTACDDSTVCGYSYETGTFVRTIGGRYEQSGGAFVYEISETLYRYSAVSITCDTLLLFEMHDTLPHNNNAVDDDSSIILDRNPDIMRLHEWVPLDFRHDYGATDSIVVSEYWDSIEETVVVYTYGIRDSSVRLNGEDKSVELYRLDRVAEKPCSAYTDTTHWCDSTWVITGDAEVCREDRVFLEGVGMLELYLDYHCLNVMSQKAFRKLSLQRARIDGITYDFTDTTMVAVVAPLPAAGARNAPGAGRADAVYYDVHGRRRSVLNAPAGVYFVWDGMGDVRKVFRVR